MDWLLFQVLNHYIPQEYMAPLLVILSAFLAFEQYLAATKRIRANSTLQLIMGFVQYFIGKEKGNDYESKVFSEFKIDPTTQKLLPDGSIVPRPELQTGGGASNLGRFGGQETDTPISCNTKYSDESCRVSPHAVGGRGTIERGSGSEQPTQTIRPEQERGPKVTGGGTTIENSGSAEGKLNEYIPDWIKGTGGLGGPSGK